MANTKCVRCNEILAWADLPTSPRYTWEYTNKFSPTLQHGLEQYA